MFTGYSPAKSPGVTQIKSGGSGDAPGGKENLAQREALAFLHGKKPLTASVLVGLHKALNDPKLVAKIVAAHKKGAKLAAKLDGGDLKALVKDPHFEWKSESDQAKERSGGGGGSEIEAAPTAGGGDPSGQVGPVPDDANTPVAAPSAGGPTAAPAESASGGGESASGGLVQTPGGLADDPGNVSTPSHKDAGATAALIGKAGVGGDAEVKEKLAALLPRVQLLMRRLHLLPKLRVSAGKWAALQRLLSRLQATLGQLPFPVTLGTTTASVDAAAAGVLVGGAGLAAILEALLMAIAVVLALMIAAFLLHQAFLAIEAIVEIIEDMLEQMRPQPPLFWSASLPLPPVPLGGTIIRQKPPNPRIPGGAQDQVRAGIKKKGLSGLLIAHHVLPLFLGGTDTVGNVVELPRVQHLIGHPSLQVQPQMIIWNYPINIYAHPPPGSYFLAGVRAP